MPGRIPASLERGEDVVHHGDAVARPSEPDAAVGRSFPALDTSVGERCLHGYVQNVKLMHRSEPGRNKNTLSVSVAFKVKRWSWIINSRNRNLCNGFRW